jgi:hypothetical protein
VAIKTKSFSIENFLGAYGYKRAIRTISRKSFEELLKDIRLQYNSTDLELIRSHLDPNNIGDYDLTLLLDVKIDKDTTNVNSLSIEDKQKLEHTFEDVRKFVKMSKNFKRFLISR